MKRILAVLLALLLSASLAACHTDPPDVPDVPDVPGTSTPADTDPPVADIPSPDFSALEKLEQLPFSVDYAILKGSPLGGTSTLYVWEMGLAYYVVHQPSEADPAEYYRGTLTLPEGYTGGRIISVGAGAGSGEIVMTVVAEKDGQDVALDYLGLSDSLGQFTATLREDIPDVPLAHLIQVVENPGNLSVHTVQIPVKNEWTNITGYTFSDRYRIYLTSEALQNDASGYLVHTDDLFIVDLAEGKIVHRETLDIDEDPFDLIYTDDGCVLMNRMPMEDGAYYKTSACYKITEANGAFTVTPVEWEAFPSADAIMHSPHGTYTVYHTQEDGWNNGGIDVKYPDGSVRRILTNVMLGDSPDCKAVGIGDVIGYTPLGFMDDTHFAYYIGGWEWSRGYGIYDLESGMATEYRDACHPLTTYDSVLFIQARTDYDDRNPILPGEIYQVHVDGTKEKMPLAGLSFRHSKWLKLESEAVGETGRIGKDTLTVFSADMTAELAKIELHHPLHRNYITYYLYENSITFVRTVIE